MLRAARYPGRPDWHRIASWSAPVTLRLAGDGDAAALRRVAELDSQPLPPGPFLVAERAGAVDAAVSLSTGALIADPFRRTAEVAALLRCHAGDALVSAQPDPAAARDNPPLAHARLVTT
jgi:hypothetical protein